MRVLSTSKKARIGRSLGAGVSLMTPVAVSSLGDISSGIPRA
jgi:hypothetical protein